MSCDKLSFDTYSEAQTVINKANTWGRVTGKRRLQNKKPKRVYKCPDCGKYHLTSKKKKFGHHYRLVN